LKPISLLRRRLVPRGFPALRRRRRRCQRAMIGIPAWRCGSSRCTGSTELRCQNAPRPHKIDSRAICQKIILIQSDSAPSDPESVISATAAPVIKALITLAVVIGYCGSLWFGGLGPELLRRTRRSSWNRKGRRFDLPGQQRKGGGKAKHPKLSSLDRRGARRRRHTGQPVCLGRAERPSSPSPAGRKSRSTSRPCRASQPEVADLHINNVNAYHGRLKECMRRFPAGPPRTCPTISDENSPRGMERPSHSAKLDPRRPRNRTESAAHAIRAVINLRLTKKTLPP
jgi:hypothetical protein